MEKSEITDLLNWAKCGDRWVDNTRPGVEFWHAAIGGETWLTPGLARAAVIAHYREETRTVMVADVLALAGELRRDRLSRVRMPDLPAGVASDPALYEAAYAAAESAILAGGDPAAAMTATIAARRAELQRQPLVTAEANGQHPAAPPETDEAFAALIAEAAPPRLIHPAAQFDEAIDWLDRGGDETLSTGYTELDDLLGGLRPREMCVIAARPGIGKTLGGLCIASHVADTLGLPVLYSSLEMARLQLELRRMSSIADVPLRRLVRAEPTPDDWQRIAEVTPRLRGTPLRIDDASPAGLAHIREALTEMDADGTPARLHILDYLGLASMPKAESRQQAVADFARSYRQLAKDVGIPVIALVQLNRNLEARRGRRPVLSDLRESGELEQVADVVILLHRDDSSAAAGDIEWIVGKNRQGAQGVVTLTFQGSRGRIADRPPLLAAPSFYGD